MDCSPPGFSVHGIFQARVLEWGIRGLLRGARAGARIREGTRNEFPRSSAGPCRAVPAGSGQGRSGSGWVTTAVGAMGRVLSIFDTVIVATVEMI